MTELSLEQRVARLEAIEKIKQLKVKYAHDLDNGYNPQGIASLFAANGEWIIEGQAIKLSRGARPSCGIAKNCLASSPGRCIS